MLSFNFSPFPVLETERLVLRRLNKNYAAIFLRLRNTDDVMQFIDRTRQKNIEEIYTFIDFIDSLINENKDINWAISLKGSGELIGTIGYYRTHHEDHRGEIGYMLDPEYWRKGIMNEALKCILDFGFNVLNFHTIEACINPENIASREILLKNNFVKEAFFRENYFYEGKYKDTEVFTKFKTD